MAAEGGSRRTIGEIVLGLGFVTEAELAAAVATQELTGKPLGQILVEAGSISRLELASALAEQWSASPDASIAAAAGSPALPPGQDALEALDDRVTGLAERLEATGRRLAELERSLLAADERMEALAGAAETLPLLQTEAAALEARVESLALAVEEAPASAELDELRTILAGLSERQARSEDGAAQLEQRVHALADESALEALRGAVAEVAGRPAGDPALAGRLDALGHEVGLLAARPAGDPELEVRVTELAARLEGVPPAGARPAAPVPDSIEPELERILMAIERLGLHIGEHDRALAELMRGRGSTRRLDELSARLDDLAAGLVAAPGPDGTAAGLPSLDAAALRRRVEQMEAALAAEREALLTRIERVASSLEWRLQRLEGAGEPAWQ